MEKLLLMEPTKPGRGTAALTENEIDAYQDQLPDWEVIDQDGKKQLHKSYQFDDFLSALAFTNRIGALAEEQNHHPALLTTWGKVEVYWSTHVIQGLHMNDLISAAKTDALK
jgi:4a-hydroxytetrahydrobiopterin dehydratase